MTLAQFSCPHCHSPFQVDMSLPSLQVACPHCQQAVALISEPPVAEPPRAAPSVFDPPPVEPEIAAPPTRVPRDHVPAELLPPRSPAETPPSQIGENESIADDYRSRQRVAEERAARRFVKNMIVWVACAIVLISILAYFLMRGGS